MSDPIALALAIELSARAVIVTVSNEGPEPVLVWSRANSWGWPTMFLLLAPPGGPDEWIELHPPDRRFTRDGPGVAEIPGSGHHRVELRPSEEHWVAHDAIGWLSDEHLLVRAVLDIPASAEAGELGVVAGRWTSAPVRSDPPHGWL
jgi:hypothetical protein